jgi:signal transduction histidine kinase
MLTSLRPKLVASHLIPTLLLLPMLSLYLLYNLEGFYTDSLLQQLENQSQLLRNDVERDPGLLTDARSASRFLAGIAPLTDSRVLLLGQDATILASTRLEDAFRVGSRYEHPTIAQALRGETAQGVGRGLSAEVAYVVLPLRHESQIIGALRLSYEVDDVRSQFDQLRLFIIGGTALIALLAIGLALGLAMTIIRPLQELSSGAQSIATGDLQSRVRVQGHDEVSALAFNFNRMVERLAEAEQARQRQLAAIVHELARPLAGMHAALETIREDANADSEMRDSLLDGVGEELGRLGRMISTLQSLHKRAFHPLRLKRTEISLERVIRASVGNFESIAARAGITLVTQVPGVLSRVNADEDRIIQVLTNLLDNACKYTPPDGQVTVEAHEDESWVWVSVADTGVGIDSDELAHLFQQFYRGGDSRPPEKRGMGLGLAICREIIRAHGGNILVESNPGQGARFSFSIPKQDL